MIIYRFFPKFYCYETQTSYIYCPCQIPTTMIVIQAIDLRLVNIVQEKSHRVWTIGIDTDLLQGGRCKVTGVINRLGGYSSYG